MKKKVLVGMSGGVDSSVSAAVLKDKGFYVEGVTLNLIGEGAEKAISDAGKVSEVLGIKHRVLDLQNDFKKCVMDYFADEYLNGRTPNPCVMCNPQIKFGLLLDYALSEGFDFIATGHYAVIENDLQNNIYKLKESNAKKDQSYFLYRLNQKQLSHAIFPVGEHEKEYTRELAKKYNLPVASKGDSQDICFINGISHGEFIENYRHVKSLSGDFVLDDGNVLGKHSGIINYTVGQRKGLGVSWSSPLYVKNIDSNNNEIHLCELENGYKDSINIVGTNFILPTKINDITEAFVKIRSRAKKVKCKFFRNDENKAVIIFNEPQKFPAPGQSAVLYDDDGYVIGGGVIV